MDVKASCEEHQGALQGIHDHSSPEAESSPTQAAGQLNHCLCCVMNDLSNEWQKATRALQIRVISVEEAPKT